jgi:tetratricopeptide (TPR) repeat protein
MKAKLFSLLFSGFLVIGGWAQDDSKYGSTPEEVEECKKNLSLYREYRDQNLPDQALPFWRAAFEVCPQSAKTLYIDGVKFYGDILDGIYEDSTKLDERNAYIDTLMLIYDKRIENFNEEGKVLTYKANDLYKYDESRAQEANAMFKRSMELMGMNTDAIAASKYYQTLYGLYRDGKVEKSDLLVEYMPVLDILEYNIAKLDDESKRERYEKAKGNLDAFFIKIAECDDIIRILGERIAQSPNDIELNKKALAVMNKRDCTDDPLYLEVAERVYADKPTASAAYSIGIQKLKSKEYSDAQKYFEEAAELCGDCIDLNQYYLRAGQSSVILGNASKARSFANKILANQPRNGDALMLIGDAVAASAKSCDDGKLGKAGAYWLAVDYYEKARNADSSVADKANQKIAGYKKYFPLKTDLFFHGLEEGASYTVECFGEKTTARSSD